MTHLKMQWAAVSTHLSVTREAPHTCLLRTLRLTCQGHFPSSLSLSSQDFQEHLAARWGEDKAARKTSEKQALTPGSLRDSQEGHVLEAPGAAFPNPQALDPAHGAPPPSGSSRPSLDSRPQPSQAPGEQQLPPLAPSARPPDAQHRESPKLNSTNLRDFRSASGGWLDRRAVLSAASRGSWRGQGRRQPILRSLREPGLKEQKPDQEAVGAARGRHGLRDSLSALRRPSWPAAGGGMGTTAHLAAASRPESAVTLSLSDPQPRQSPAEISPRPKG